MSTAAAIARGTALVNAPSPAQDLVDLLLSNRQLLVRSVVDNNFTAVALNMQQALGSTATYTPKGLENIILAANTPERIALMDQVLDVPWIPGNDPGMDRAVALLKQKATGMDAGLSTRMDPNLAAGGLAALIGIVGGLIGGKGRERDAERAAQQAAAEQRAAAERRKQLLIAGGILLLVLIMAFTLYRLAR